MAQHKVKNDNHCIIEQSATTYFDLAQDYLKIEKFGEAQVAISKFEKALDYKSLFKIDKRLAKLPELSIIIVAYNSKKDLLDCVNSIFTNNPDKSYEIIVVDNGRNEEVLNELWPLDILYISTGHNFYPSVGRNIGAFFSRGRIISFVDDDALVEKGYVANIIKSFENKKIIALRGKILKKTLHYNNFCLSHYNLGNKVKNIRYILTETNCAFVKDKYVQIGGFSSLFFGHEGIELSFRIEQIYGSSRIIYNPDIIVKHDFAIRNDKLKTKDLRHKSILKYLRFVHPDIDRFIENGGDNMRGKYTKKIFLLKNLLFRSIKNPYKILTLPINIFRILLKNEKK